MGESSRIDRWGLEKGLITAAEFCSLVGFRPDPWQLRLMEAQDDLCVCCSRQVGKSEASAHAAVFDALSEPKSLILIIAPAHRQSKELLLKAKDVVEALPWDERLIEDNKEEIWFSNRSRIVALPSLDPQKIRSYSKPKRVIIEEAAMVSEEAFDTVSPMLATSNGSIRMISSPMGKRGRFFEAFNDPEVGKISITAWECSRIPKKFLEKERRKLGPAWFGQEYECEFLDVSMNVFGVPRFVESGMLEELL